ncbi:MAG TPA: TetR/AcrR family transcriptional regulator [Pseudonocardia sp.]|nr:TetR/AcrR family transcriptional regulator [Pseudonocardia sp.]
MQRAVRTELARRRLLDAAAEVVAAHGALTLDAVARRAAISKGGLLHHFGSKEALAEALIVDLMDRFEHAVDDAATALPEPGSWLRAYVTVGTAPTDTSIVPVALAAFAINPALVVHLRRRQRRWAARAGQGLAPGLASVVRLAVDGLWLGELSGPVPERDEVRSALLAVVDLAAAT